MAVTVLPDSNEHASFHRNINFDQMVSAHDLDLDSGVQTRPDPLLLATYSARKTLQKKS